MIDIKKYDDNLNYEMIKYKTLEIFYIDNSDLFWSCNTNDNCDLFSITIEKSNNYIYCLFDELYNSIISAEPFKYLKYDFNNKNLLFPHDIEDPRCLVKNDIILEVCPISNLQTRATGENHPIEELYR